MKHFKIKKNYNWWKKYLNIYFLKHFFLFLDNLIKWTCPVVPLSASIDVLSFDFQQNMPLPHITSGDVFYKRLLWSYNFCVHSASTGKSYYFMYNKTVARKGQNEVVSFLHYYFKNILSQNIKMVFLFSDNCSSQNKNKLLFQYLSVVVNSQTFSFKSIIHRYPEPGHSFLPCDRCFGHIKKAIRNIETVI